MRAFLGFSYRSSEMGGGTRDNWITGDQHRQCVYVCGESQRTSTGPEQAEGGCRY